MVEDDRIKKRQLIKMRMKQKQQWKQHRHKNKGVMVRKEKKTQSARMASKHKPPSPSLSRTIHWQTPSHFTRGTSLCPPVHYWHRRTLDHT